MVLPLPGVDLSPQALLRSRDSPAVAAAAALSPPGQPTPRVQLFVSQNVAISAPFLSILPRFVFSSSDGVRSPALFCLDGPTDDPHLLLLFGCSVRCSSLFFSYFPDAGGGRAFPPLCNSSDFPLSVPLGIAGLIISLFPCPSSAFSSIHGPAGAARAALPSPGQAFLASISFLLSNYYCLHPTPF